VPFRRAPRSVPLVTESRPLTETFVALAPDSAEALKTALRAFTSLVGPAAALCVMIASLGAQQPSSSGAGRNGAVVPCDRVCDLLRKLLVTVEGSLAW
jgi:hypothetical protein